MEYKNKWCLITGASAGIGVEFATQFAALGANLILVARRKERLEALAEQLRKSFAIEVDVLPMDLAKADAAETIFHTVKEKNRQVDILINNAGLGAYGLFDQTDIERNQQQINVNVLALTLLTQLFLRNMLTANQGIIINVASIASFNPLGYLSVYAATKAYVLSFTEALWAEYQNTGIRFLAVCPGPVETEFFAVAKMKNVSGSIRDSAKHVVEKTVRALSGKKPSVIIASPKNVFLTIISRVFPRGMVAKMAKKMMQPKT